MDLLEFINHLNREQDGAWCSTLKIGQLSILLDCGCDELNCDKFDIVAQHAAKCDYIFLSHASTQMMGALPYLQKQGILGNLQVLGTLPVAKLGA